MLVRNVGGLGLVTLVTVGAFLGCRSAAPPTQPQSPPAAYNPPAQPNVPPTQPDTPQAQPDVPAQSQTDNPAAGGVNGDMTQPVPTSATAPLSARDKEVIRLRQEPLTSGKPAADGVKWVADGDGVRAEFRADAGSNSWSRVKIDLNGNKKWDEKWDFKPDGTVKRRVAPADDENYTAEYRLKPGGTEWTRVK